MAKAKKVNETEVESGMAEMVEDAKGNAYLPGTAPVVIKELVASAKAIELELKPAFGSARDALVAEQENLAGLAHKYIDHFSEPDEKSKRVYRAGGVEVAITFQKEKILTKIDDDGDE